MTVNLGRGTTAIGWASVSLCTLSVGIGSSRFPGAMVSVVLVVGAVFTATAIVEIAFAEGLRAVARPLDFRGIEPNREPYKRATFHLMYVLGFVLLVVSAVAAVLR